MGALVRKVMRRQPGKQGSASQQAKGNAEIAQHRWCEKQQ
jgi:hypothetical protein